MTERPGQEHSVVLMSQDAGLPAVTRDTHSSRAALQASVGLCALEMSSAAHPSVCLGTPCGPGVEACMGARSRCLSGPN